MKSDRLVRFYDRLTADERFRMVLDAAARHDPDDLRTLTKTCPRKTYRMADADYLELLDRSRWAVAWLSSVWLAAGRELAHSEVAKAAVHFCEVMFAQGVEVGLGGTIPNHTHPVWEQRSEVERALETLGQQVEQRYRQAVAMVKGIDAGFRRFCEAASLQPEKLLAWDARLRDEMHKMRVRLEADIPPDEEIAEATYQRLCERWPEVVTGKGNGR